MKNTARILLFFLIAFLVTPTIVSVIKKGSNVSVFHNCSEEEQMQKEINDIKAIFNSDTAFVPSYFSELNSSLIHSENLSKHDKISSKIFIPPPEQV